MSVIFLWWLAGAMLLAVTLSWFVEKEKNWTPETFRAVFLASIFWPLSLAMLIGVLLGDQE